MELNVEKISNKICRFQLSDAGEEVEVKIQIPDLTQLEYDVWGDWGRIYSFKLLEDQAILISFGNRHRTLHQKVLSIEAPMLAREREVYPYHIVIEDSERGSKYLICLGKNFDFEKVIVKKPSEKRAVDLRATESADFSEAM